MTEGRNPLGPVGGYVAENIRLLREERRLAYTELAARLEHIGRPIAVLGLSRIERGQRRVDADDLVAITIALGVNPSALLLPRRGNAADMAAVTPKEKHTLAALWLWADGCGPLPRNSVAPSWREVSDFLIHARPEQSTADTDPAQPPFTLSRAARTAP
jgi:transcriptional regulator with XRE-family HTH domain